MKNTSTLVILLFLLSCADGKNGDARLTTASDSNSANIARIESGLYPVFVLEGETQSKTIKEMMESLGVPGLSIAFVDDGQLAWARGYGYADLGDSIPVTPRTVFRAASLSKPLTAMVSLQLVAEGVIDMEEEVSPRLSGWSLPENQFAGKQKVTVANLIGHRSGIGNDVHPGYPENATMPTNEDILMGRALNKPVRFIAEPGTQTRYSNVGYMVLSKLLSDLSGKPFDLLMQERLFRPLDMNSSTFNQLPKQDIRSRLATGYDASQQPLPYYRYPFEGAGSLMTTPSDLGVFLSAVMEDYRQQPGGRVIPHSMAQQVFSRSEGKLGFNKWYSDSSLVYRNDGSIPGFNGFLMGVPDRGQAVVVLANANSEAAYDLLNHVWRAVAMEYNWGYFEPHFYTRKELSPAVLDAFSGQYENGRDTLSIHRGAEGLVLDSGSAGVRPLVFVGENTFLEPVSPLRLTFGSDSGKDTDLKVWNHRGDDLPGYRRLR